MKWKCSLVLSALLAGRASAQDVPATVAPGPLIGLSGAAEPSGPSAVGMGGSRVESLAAVPSPDLADCCRTAESTDRRDRLTGNHNFANFINWMSNPLSNIDPRAVTAVYPLFANEWVRSTPPIPNADAQLYGPAITVALSERFAFGLNQGGYAVAHLDRNPIRRNRLFAIDPLAQFRDAETRNIRTGFLNTGGFVQYTLVEDVERQFLLTAGLRFVAPVGSYELFQGHGPLELAPYVTVGKEFGKFHVLATTGFVFPAGPGSDNRHVYYANVHFDRQCFGWFYPLVEFNTNTLTKSANVGLTTRRGFIDFGNFESTGTVVSLAAGANAVLIRERLEFGAVYTTVISSQSNLSANGLLAKMTLRY